MWLGAGRDGGGRVLTVVEARGVERGHGSFIAHSGREHGCAVALSASNLEHLFAGLDTPRLDQRRALFDLGTDNFEVVGPPVGIDPRDPVEIVEGRGCSRVWERKRSGHRAVLRRMSLGRRLDVLKPE